MNELRKANTPGKYTLIEIIFFIVFFFLFPIVTDIEYNLNEPLCEKCDNGYLDIVIRRMVFGVFQAIPFIFLYKILLHKLLLKKKYGYFLGSFILFLFALDLYIVYVQYWSISKMYFLPGNITRDAASWFKIDTLFHFSVIYVIDQTLIFTALAFFINYAKQEERMNALKQAKLQSDLDQLKAQVQPHFFFNTLNNVYSLALQRSESTAPLVARLSDMMRYVIYETVNSKVSLKKEVDFLKNYVAVESVRYNETIMISFDTQGINDNATIEPLLLLPIIENMFKHGVQHATGKGFIEIVVCLTGNELMLQAKNSKPEIKIKSAGDPGIGLANVKKRLQLLYPGKHSLKIQDDEYHYELLLTLQLY